MKRRAQSQISVSLFPFLAVLLCMMGALIVVLVVVSRQGVQAAAETAEAKAKELTTDLTLQIEEKQWRIDTLNASRAKTEKDLEERRARLRELEEHLRSLMQKLDRVKQQGNELANTDKESLKSADELQDQLRDVELQLNRARREYASAVDENANRKPSFAIIPYEGPHRTNRPPIYLECLADRVVFQPEGITLWEDDLSDAEGAENTVAVAMRAAASYLEHKQELQGIRPKPAYPLLLVRPNGIGAFYATRAAMHYWGSDSGYELLAQDASVAYLPKDEGLASAIQEAVDRSRKQRRRGVARSRGRNIPFQDLSAESGGGREEPDDGYYRVSPSGGGLVRDDGPAGGVPYRPKSNHGVPRNSRYGDSAGHGQDRDAPDNAGGSSGNAGGDRYAGRNPRRQPERESNDEPPEQPGSGAPASRYGDRYGNERGDGSVAGGRSSAKGDGDSMSAGNLAEPQGSNSTRDGSQPLADSSSLDGPSTQNEPSSLKGSSPRKGDSPDENSSGTLSKAGASGRSFAANKDGTAAEGRKGNPSSSSGAAHSGGNSSSSSGAAGGSPGAGSMPTVELNPVAKERGEGWALPESVNGQVPIERPVTLKTAADEIEIIPDNRRDRPIHVALDGPTEDALPSIVESVFTRVQTWGSAGNGMYWKPILEIDVVPGGETRYYDLKTLLEESGLEVRLKHKVKNSRYPTTATPELDDNLTKRETWPDQSQTNPKR